MTYFITSIVVGLVTIYAFVAFTRLEANPLKWPRGTRIECLINAVVWSVVFVPPIVMIAIHKG